MPIETTVTIQEEYIVTPIPDGELDPLRTIVANGHERPEGVSRFDFMRGYDAEEQEPSRRFDSSLTDEEAELRIQRLRPMLGLLLTQIEDEVDQTRKEIGFHAIYYLGTAVSGLSRLEVENLAPHSPLWLEYCIQLDDPVGRANASNAGDA